MSVTPVPSEVESVTVALPKTGCVFDTSFRATPPSGFQQPLEEEPPGRETEQQTVEDGLELDGEKRVPTHVLLL